ncbi:unnamed protein product [Symbiodinium sp. CCMP2592]|nr:unnamed protein product [Symbiodinium sp. CCMP2592]
MFAGMANQFASMMMSYMGGGSAGSSGSAGADLPGFRLLQPPKGQGKHSAGQAPGQQTDSQQDSPPPPQQSLATQWPTLQSPTQQQESATKPSALTFEMPDISPPPKEEPAPDRQPLSAQEAAKAVENAVDNRAKQTSQNKVAGILKKPAAAAKSTAKAQAKSTAKAKAKSHSKMTSVTAGPNKGWVVEVVYFSLKQFGGLALSKEDAWFVLTAIRSIDVKRLSNGMTQLMKRIFAIFLLERREKMLHGISLPMPNSQHWMLCLLIADEAALKSVWEDKGASGTKLCFMCQNVVAHSSSLHSCDATGTLVSHVCHNKGQMVRHTDETILEAAVHLADNKPRMNKGEFKMRQFALGLNYAEHGPLFSAELRPHMKPIAVSMYDWMHNFVVGGIFQVEMTELLKVLRRQGIPQSELHRFLSDCNWPSAVGDKGASAKKVFAKTLTDFKSGASECMALYPAMRAFLQDKLPLIRDHDTKECCRCFFILCEVLDQLYKTATPGDVASLATTLEHKVSSHLELFKACYGEDYVLPKHHMNMHLGDLLRRHSVLLSCFVHERRHKEIKRYANNLDSMQTGSEKHVLQLELEQHLKDLKEFSEKRAGLINGKAAPELVQSAFSSFFGLPACAGLQVSMKCYVGSGRLCKREDVVVVSEPNGDEVAQVWFHVVFNGNHYTCMSVWRALGRNRFDICQEPVFRPTPHISSLCMFKKAAAYVMLFAADAVPWKHSDLEANRIVEATRRVRLIRDCEKLFAEVSRTLGTCYLANRWLRCFVYGAKYHLDAVAGCRLLAKVWHLKQLEYHGRIPYQGDRRWGAGPGSSVHALRAWLRKRGWQVTSPFVWQGATAQTRLDLTAASTQTKGQMQHHCRQQWRLWCLKKFLLGKRHEAREFRNLYALPALMRQAEDIDLERLREFARESAEGRSVLLGAAVSPAWLAHCTQADSAHFVCPCCGTPRASWYHMAMPHALCWSTWLLRFAFFGDSVMGDLLSELAVLVLVGTLLWVISYGAVRNTAQKDYWLVPSHFNTSTHEDASLYMVKLVSVGVLGIVCFLAALGVHVRPTSTATKVLALQHGSSQLCVSVMVAAVQVVQGHFFKESLPNEDALCHWATGGVSGSPCYEVRGRAVVKLAHFLPLHITEVLLMLEWMLSIVPQAPAAIPKENVLRLAAGCCWLMSLLGIFQVLRGEPLILGLEILRHWEGLALITSMAALAVTFFWALLQPGTVLSNMTLFFDFFKS